MNNKTLYGLISREAKKISFNLDESTLMMIDELAKGTKTTRTMIINGLIGHGMKKFINVLHSEGTEMKKERKKDPKKIDDLLSFLRQFEKKWYVNKFP